MRSFLILISFFILLSCSSDNNIDSSNIVGTWKLAQVLADPGDGSGTFVDVESNKTITFLNDNTFSSNGNVCFFGSFDRNDTQGEFSIEDEEIIPTNCDSFLLIKHDYKIENSALIIYYYCIEGCAEKYVKIE